MRSKFAIFGMIACLAFNPAYAEESASREENIGVGSGAVIGAVAGGPVGAILGAAIGAKLGEVFAGRKLEVAALNDTLDISRAHINKLEKDILALNGSIDSLDGDLAQMRSVARPNLLTLMQAGIEMDLLFRTDEDELGISTDSKLRALATSLSTMPGIFVQLDGFADERGDTDYNQNLSARRAEHVRNILISNGVDESRITVAAHGESPAADDNVDSFALERKVSLTLFVEDTPSFASNPD